MTSIKHFLAEQKDKKALIPVEEERQPKAKRLMKLLTKKNITVASLIAVIGVAVYLNWAFNPDYKLDATNTLTGDAQAGAGDKTLGDTIMVDSEAADADSFFAASLVDRQRARDQAVETLQAVVYNAESMPDVKNNALAEIASIAKDVEQEAAIQTLIKSKGFKECIAVINGENCNVIVQSSGLMPNEVSQIKEIVYEQSKILPDKIKIIEKN